MALSSNSSFYNYLVFVFLWCFIDFSLFKQTFEVKFSCSFLFVAYHISNYQLHNFLNHIFVGSLIRPNFVETLMHQLTKEVEQSQRELQSSNTLASFSLSEAVPLKNPLSEMQRKPLDTRKEVALILCFQHQLQMHIDMLQFLTLCISREPSFCAQIILDKTVLVSIVQLLAVVYTGKLFKIQMTY